MTVLGLAVEKLRAVFSPSHANPPLGGGTDDVYLLAGDTVVPPPWLVGDDEDTSCEGCGPYLWVRLARRWRTERFPVEAVVGKCGTSKAITIEAGIARCHPLDGTLAELEHHAAVQWDDSHRIDAALCAAMKAAKAADVITEYGLGAGVPVGPEGLVAVWLQPAYVELNPDKRS
ncbi:hypothetical protein [Nocardia farcinica]|uniref:hypothetical protein n=1 Tax=Nocardia farcinica TaxID=37329 RepID=UPI0024569666|nr:hypothetical protein [Nocardia farcinica]